MKVGLGYDIHRLQKGEKLILGGVEIPFDSGLQGHSDADVLTHALIDALLGAMGMGDIGQHFPDSDQQYHNISSLVLLEKVYEIMLEEKYELNNADLILVAEKPKITPFSESIVSNLSDKLNTEQQKINFKATTAERLGFIGKGQGMSAKAIVSLASLSN